MTSNAASGQTAERSAEGPVTRFDIVSRALRSEHFTDTARLFELLARHLSADGCALWKVRYPFRATGSPPPSSLFQLSGWFSDPWLYRLVELPVDGPLNTAQAASGQFTLTTPPIHEDTRFHPSHSFDFQFASAPINFLGGSAGAVVALRNSPQPFSRADQLLLADASDILPALIVSIRDKASLSLIRASSAILGESTLHAPSPPPSSRDMENVILKLAHALSTTFDCVETSIFLVEDLEIRDHFTLFATTWPLSETINVRSHKLGERGLTSWALTHASPVKIVDLDLFEPSSPILQSEYPGITWTVSLSIHPHLRDLLCVRSDVPTPPASYIAAPVVMGDTILGVIRCSCRAHSPYVFANDDLELLLLVTAQLAQFWSAWLSRRETKAENESWQVLHSTISALNRFVHEELTQPAPRQEAIIEEALKATSAVIPGANALDVRLFDRGANVLRYSRIFGDAWDRLGEAALKARQNQVFAIEENSADRGVRAFLSGEVDLRGEPGGEDYRSGLFPDATAILVIPIRVASRSIGVMDVRIVGEERFPRHARAIGELIGNELGIHLHAARTLSELRDARSSLERNFEQQRRMYEDLTHQITGPAIQAHSRLLDLLPDPLPDTPYARQLLQMRGLLGKARRVAMSTRIFASLSRNDPIPVHPSRVTHDWLIKELVAVASDNEILFAQSRNIRFDVDRRDIEQVWQLEVYADYDLLDQALRALLDNAAKYSFKDTRVRVYVGTTGTGRFQIAVQNKGLKILPRDVNNVKVRQWRGDLARLTTGEGSGIGLWITDEIMRSHGGDLVVVPTNQEGITEVKLVFTVGRR